jgi:uncharacterized DUF497 family protein
MEFRWNDWNIDHIGGHGVWPEEAEWVVDHYRPCRAGKDKYLTRGQTQAGRYLQVAFVIDPDDAVFVIHARDLTEREKQAFRRRRR